MTIAISLLVHGEAVRFNRGQNEATRKFDFKYLEDRQGKVYPYVSSQCYKKFWREALQSTLSPVIRPSSKQAYTVGDPINYVDDDLFGYMLAGAKKEKGVEEEGDSQESDGTGSDESEDISLFEVGNLNDPNKFIERLRQAGNPFSEYLLGKFSDENRSRLVAHTTRNDIPLELESVLVQALNQLLTESRLFNEEPFQAKLTRKIRGQVGANPTGADLSFLNRAALLAVFNNELGTKKEKRPTTRRTAPIRMHALVAFTGIKTAKDFQTFSRDAVHSGGNSLPNPSPPGIYSAWLKTRILIEGHRIGRFQIGENHDLLLPDVEKIPEAERAKIRDEANPYDPSKPMGIYELTPEHRLERLKMAVRALADIGNQTGPASGALHDGSLRPKAFIAAQVKCADSPFDYVWKDGQPLLDPDRLKDAVEDWADLFATNKIYIGWPIDGDPALKEDLEKTINSLTFEGETKFEAVIKTPRQALLELAKDCVL